MVVGEPEIMMFKIINVHPASEQSDGRAGPCTSLSPDTMPARPVYPTVSGISLSLQRPSPPALVSLSDCPVCVTVPRCAY